MEAVMTKVNKRDFTSGGIWLPMLTFAVPLMLSGLLQVLYNAADRIVVGQFSSDGLALAAIGASGSVTALVINTLIGLSGGVSVAVAQYIGKRSYAEAKGVTATAFAVAAVGGVVFTALGLILSEPLVVWIVNKPELIPKALLYIRLIFLGIPASAIYNFGSAAQRSRGNSFVPLMIGGVSGIINVGLNILFVCAFGMTVDGVAIATVISQYVSAVWVLLLFVFDKEEGWRIMPRELRPEKKYVFELLRLGAPMSAQSFLLCFANMICASVFNSSFDTNTVTANSVAGSIDIVIFTVMTAFGQAVTVFVGQNFGAGDIGRVKRSIVAALFEVVIFGLSLGGALYFFGSDISVLFINSEMQNKEEVLKICYENWFSFLAPMYFIHGMSTVLNGAAKGLGYSLSASLIALFSEFAFKIGWSLFIFPLFGTVRWFLMGHVSGWASSLILTSILLALILIRLKASPSQQNNTTGEADNN